MRDWEFDHEGLARWLGLGDAGAGGQDRADVSSPPASERDSPAQRRDQFVAAVCGLQRGELLQLDGQPGVAGRGRPPQPLLRYRPEGAERLLRWLTRPDLAGRDGRPGTAVVRIDDAGLSSGEQHVVGDDLTGGVDEHREATGAGLQRDLLPNEGLGHRVAGACEPDGGELVDLAGLPPTDARPQRRQRLEQHQLRLGQALGRDRADLRVPDTVDFRAPPDRRRVRQAHLQRALQGAERDHQVGLGVADEVLHNPLARRVIALAKIRAEGVVHRESDVVRRRDHHVRDDAGLQAPHPVREHDLRDPTEGLEALG